MVWIWGLESYRQRTTREADRLNTLGTAVGEQRRSDFLTKRFRDLASGDTTRYSPPTEDPVDDILDYFKRHPGEPYPDKRIRDIALDELGKMASKGGFVSEEDEPKQDFYTAIVEGAPASASMAGIGTAGPLREAGPAFLKDFGNLLLQTGALALPGKPEERWESFKEAGARALSNPLFAETTVPGFGLLPPETGAFEPIGKIPVIGPAAKLEAEALTTPLAAMTFLGLAPLAGGGSAFANLGRQARFFGAGSAGGVAAGTVPRELGAPEGVSIGAQVAGNILAPGAGLVPGGVVTKPVTRLATGLRGVQPEDAKTLLRRALIEETGGGTLEDAQKALRGGLDANATPPGEQAAGELPTSFPRTRATVRVGDIETRPDLFQARDADPGSAVSAKRVQQLVEGWDESQYSAPHVVLDPETGKPIIYRGHHRTEAFKRVHGDDATTEVVVVGADIRNPDHLAALMLEGDASNFKTALPNFRESVRAVTRAEAVGLQDAEIASRLRKSVGEIEALKDANRLGASVLDRVVLEPTLGPVAEELGRGVRVYGFSAEDGAAWFARIAEGPKGQRPTIGALRETIDKFGRELKKVDPEMFAGFGEAGGTRGGILEVIDNNAKLRTQLESQVRRVKRTQNQVNDLAKTPGITKVESEAAGRTVKLAKRVQVELEREIAQNNRDVLAAFKEAQVRRPADLFDQRARGVPSGERPAEAISSGEATRAASATELEPMMTANEAALTQAPSAQRSATTVPEGVSAMRTSS